jgi:hypothetical protein
MCCSLLGVIGNLVSTYASDYSTRADNDSREENTAETAMALVYQKNPIHQDTISGCSEIREPSVKTVEANEPVFVKGKQNPVTSALSLQIIRE